MAYATVETHATGPILAVAPNRPEVRNAFNAQMIDELSDCFAGFSDMFQAIDPLQKPTVGRVHGAALGGGMGLIEDE